MRKLALSVLFGLTLAAAALAQTNSVPISQLPPAITLSGTEIVPIVQNKITRQTTVGSFLNTPFLSLALDGQFGSAQGGILYRGASSWSFLAPGMAGLFLQAQGAGANPQWAVVPGSAPGNPTAQIGLSAVNGSAPTFMRSDAAPPLSLAISPTWTGTHTFNNTAYFSNSTYSALFTGGNVGIGTTTPSEPLTVTAAGAPIGLIGQGASTNVSILGQPTSPASGRAYAIAGQVTSTSGAAGGDKVGVFGASQSGSTNQSDVWGGNFLAQWDAGSSSDINVQGVEIDMNNNFSSSFSKLKTGLSVNSGGTFNGDYAILLGATSGANKWSVGLLMPSSAVNAGIAIGNPTTITGDISIKQLNNGADTILLQRVTDSSPSGDFLRAVNAANSQNITIIDATGNLSTAGEITGGSPGLRSVALSLTNGSGTCTHTPGASSETVSCSSDGRLKANIKDAPSALPWLNSFRIRDFRLRADGSRRAGTIAQEVMRHHPDMVHRGDDGFYRVDEPNPWQIMKALQEIEQKVSTALASRAACSPSRRVSMPGRARLRSSRLKAAQRKAPPGRG